MIQFQLVEQRWGVPSSTEHTVKYEGRELDFHERCVAARGHSHVSQTLKGNSAGHRVPEAGVSVSALHGTEQ